VVTPGLFFPEPARIASPQPMLLEIQSVGTPLEIWLRGESSLGGELEVNLQDGYHKMRIASDRYCLHSTVMVLCMLPSQGSFSATSTSNHGASSLNNYGLAV
jgi:hypothetical protein